MKGEGEVAVGLKRMEGEEEVGEELWEYCQ